MKSANQARYMKSRAERRKARLRRDAGAAAVEFALVLPILLALVFGIIYFGYIFAAQISLNSSARDASRAGVVQPISGTAMDCNAIAQAARTGALTIGLDTTKIKVKITGPAYTCTLNTDGTATGDLAKLMCTQPPLPAVQSNAGLTVELAYTAVSPVPLVPLSSVNLKATGAFQCEYN